MSNVIDERVVEMKFDNKQFESNAQTSLSTLQKLKQALNFDKTSSALSGLDKASSALSFEGLNAAIDTVNNRFSIMGEIGVTALHRIVDQAVSAGEKMIKALTIDPIKTGLEEYETKMNAVQVIKANTRGKNTMSDITAALEELNAYADKTIYNFAQMTNNVGKFTAQGLDVQQATAAIKGMANLAAASGASAADMARATYQMSQSLGGVIRKIDWNSLRNANMATTTLKDTLIDLARVHGIAIDEMIADAGNFEDTLQNGWLSGDMFTEAMNIYSGVYDEMELKAMGFNEEQIKNFQDLAKMAEEAATKVKTITQLFDVMKEAVQSQWTQTWEYIIGDFDESGEVLTAISDKFNEIIGASGEARNAMLKEWHDDGGRADLIAGFAAMFDSLGQILGAVRDAFRDLFPPMTAKTLLDLTKKFRAFMESLKPTEEMLKGVYYVAKLFFNAIRKRIFIFEILLKIAGKILLVIGQIIAKILEWIGVLGDWVTGFMDGVKQSEAFEKAMSSIKGIAASVKNSIKTLVDNFSSLSDRLKDMPGVQKFLQTLSDIKDWLSDKIISGVNKLADAFESLSDSKIEMPTIDDLAGAIDFVAGKCSDFIDLLDRTISKIADWGSGVWSNISEFFSSIGIDASIETVLQGIAGGFDAVYTALTNIKNDAGDTLNSIGTAITNLIGDPKDIKAKVEKAVGAIHDGLAKLLDGLDAGKLAKIAAIAGGLTALFSIVDFLIKLKNAFKEISSIPENVNDILVEVKNTLRIYQQQLKAKILLTIAMAVGILAAAIFALSLIPMNTLTSVTSYLVVLMFVLNTLVKTFNNRKMKDTPKAAEGFMKIVNDFAEGIKKAFSRAATLIGIAFVIVGVAAAVAILAKVILSISKLPFNEFIDGLGKVALILVLLIGTMTALSAVVTKFEGSQKIGLGMAITFIAIAAAVAIMAKVFEGLADMKGNVGNAVLALITISICLAMLGAIAGQVDSKSMLGFSVAMVILAGAMALMVKVLDMATSLDVGKGWAGIGATVTVMVALGMMLVVVSKAVDKALGSILAMAAMIALFAGLVFVMKKMEAVNWKAVGGGIAAVLISMVVMGAILVVLSAFSQQLIALSGAFAIFGLGLAAIGISVLAFAKGIEILAKSLVPFGQAFLDLADLVKNNSTKITDAFFALMRSFSYAVVAAAPYILGAVLWLLIMLCVAIVDNATIITDALGRLCISLINWLGKAAQVLVDVLFGLVIAVIQGLAVAIYNNTDPILAAITNLFRAIMNLAAQAIFKLIDYIFSLLDSLLGSNPAWHALIEKARGGIATLSENAKNAFKLEEVGEYGTNYANAFGEGIGEGVPGVLGKLTTLFGAPGEALIEAEPQLTQGQEHFNEMLANGTVTDGTIQRVEEQSGELADAATNPLADAIPIAGERGGELSEEFISKLQDGSGEAFDAASLLKDQSLEGLLDEDASGEAGDSNISAFIDKFKGANVKPAAEKVAKDATSAMKDPVGAKNSGGATVSSFASGVRNRRQIAIDAAKNAGTTAANSAHNQAASENSGANTAKGVAKGIHDNTWRARAAAEDMARQVNQGYDSIAKIKSPSRVMMQSGRYTVEGLIVGMMQMRNKLRGTSEGIADTGMEAMNEVIEYINSLIDGSLEYDPTIRPVLDVSGIQNGLDTVDDMLGRPRALASGLINGGSTTTVEQQITAAVDKALNGLYDKIDESIRKQPLTINVPLSIDKRKFARATATVTREELDRIDYFNNRKAGIA